MVLLDESLAARELAIEIAAFSESSGREIDEIFASLLQRRGSPKLSGPSEEIVPAAHLVRARMTELRRKFLKIADEQGPPHDDVDEWLQNAVEMLRSRELKPRART